MTITPRQIWSLALLVVLLLAARLLFPRYEWETHWLDTGFPSVVRIDRWTGHADRGVWISGRWMSEIDACHAHAWDADLCHRDGL